MGILTHKQALTEGVTGACIFFYKKNSEIGEGYRGPIS